MSDDRRLAEDQNNSEGLAPASAQNLRNEKKSRMAKVAAKKKTGERAVTLGDARMPLRFWRKVSVADGGCWNWTGHIGRDMYGRYRVGGKGSRTGVVHRIVYVALVGDVPRDVQLDHLCRNRSCCNPHHLEPVTPRVNTLRGLTRAAANAAKTACPQGHEYSGKNINGERICRTCNTAAMRRHRQKKVANG